MEEIKEIIEICLLGDCTGCPLHDYSHCRDILLRDTLNVLNALEKENQELMMRSQNDADVIRDLRAKVATLEGQIEAFKFCISHGGRR